MILIFDFQVSAKRDYYRDVFDIDVSSKFLWRRQSFGKLSSKESYEMDAG